MLGQITGGFIPIAADARDVVANVSKDQWGYAILSGVGFIPVAGDAAKICGALGEFIAKNTNNAPMIIKAINKVFEQVPDIAKHLPSSSFDNIIKSLKESQGISKDEYLKLKKIFEASGRNLDEFIEMPFKYADEISQKISSIATKYKNLECEPCANKLMDCIKNNGINGKKISMSAQNAYQDIIYSNSFGEAISYNGKHFAIEFNGKVYDNIHPNGIEFNEWISDFDSSGVISYIIEEF